MESKKLSLVAKPMEHLDQRAHHSWTFVLMSLTEAKNIHVGPIELGYLYEHPFRARGIITLTPTRAGGNYIYDLYAIEKKLSPRINEVVEKLIDYANHPSFRPSMHAFADYIWL